MTFDETLILHDGRVPGGAGAVVLARLLTRAGYPGVTVRHLQIGQTARYFWTEGVNALIDEGSNRRRLILFGVTFYDLENQVAENALRQLTRVYGELEIWSHRWPDGYSDAVPSVNIPPQDIIYGPLGFGLQQEEKRLLRLSLIAARAIPVGDHQEDLRLVQALSSWVQQDENNWDRLVSEPELDVLMDEARNGFRPNSRKDAALIIESPAEYLDIEISAEHASYEIPIIDELLDSQASVVPSRVVLAWLGTDRVLITRRQHDQQVASVRWLIDNRLQTSVPPELRQEIYGPQDAVYFRLPLGHDRAALRPKLRTLATQLAQAETGGRFLSAALARSLAELANEVFSSLDLTGQFTGSFPNQRQIEVAAKDLYDLIHTSSRSGERRHTLVVPVRVYGAKAVAFFFRDGGYNFQKAERLLEGAVLALSRTGVSWLGLPPQPKRLRLDVRPILSSTEAKKVRSALNQPRVQSVKSQGLVNSNSVIGKFLTYLSMDSLITYAESETIGPSVAHALMLKAVAEAVRDRSAQPKVLDLFAGSGIAHRYLIEAGIDVTSVDLFVSARSVGLEAGSVRSGLWLLTDARAVLDTHAPIISDHFSVVGLDPPHSELLELLFGAEKGSQSLVDLCSARSNWIVLYQGHSTQRGRLDLLVDGLGKRWPNRAIVQVEEELLVLGATKSVTEERFRHVVQQAIIDVNNAAQRLALPQVHAQEITVVIEPKLTSPS